MDILLYTTTDNVNSTPLWDFVLDNGIVTTIARTEEQKQRAIVASFLQRGTIPQVRNSGNPWAEMLSGTVSPVEVDANIRKNIQDQVNVGSYGPVYEVVKNRLIVTIKEGQNG